jgi:hypothetical protein
VKIVSVFEVMMRKSEKVMFFGYLYNFKSAHSCYLLINVVTTLNPVINNKQNFISQNTLSETFNNRNSTVNFRKVKTLWSIFFSIK